MEITRFSLDSGHGRSFRSASAELMSTDTIRQLLPALQNPRNVFIVGGFLRRAVRLDVEGVEEPVGDLDVIVDGSGRAPWLDVSMLDGRVSRNVFGGYRWSSTGFFRHVDIWSLESHYSIREFKREPKIEEAMRGFPLNLDRAALNLLTREVHDGGLVAGVRRRLIEFDADDRYLLHLQAIRVVLLLRKTKYALGRQARELVASKPWLGMEQEMASYLLSDGWDQSAVAGLFDEANSLADELRVGE